MVSMTDAKKISGGRADSAIKIVLIAEAWTAESEPRFNQICASLWDALLDVAPFNLLYRHPDALSIWTSFTPSSQFGPSPTTPGDTLVGSTFDTQTRALAFDGDRVTTVLNAMQLPMTPGPVPLAPLAGEQYWWGTSGSAVICFLVPPTADGNSISGELDASAPFAAPSWPSKPRWVGCTVDDGWQSIVIRQLARLLGLGDEWADPAPEFAAISNADTGFALAVTAYPNLLLGPAPTGLPTPEMKWYPELDSAARQRRLRVVTDGTQSSEPIALYEGAGWFRTGVFRSSADCFMTRRIGDPGLSPRAVVPSFCVLCRRTLSVAIAGTRGRASRIPLDRQRLLIDEVTTWSQFDVHRGTVPATVDFNVVPRGAEPYWSFTARIGADVGGLRIENLQLNRLPSDSLAESTVASQIDLRDISFELDNGSKVSFDIAAAFSARTAQPVLVVGADGAINPTEPHLPHAISLTLADDLGGQCPVEVTLAFAVRAPYPDIDPAGSIRAAKFFPQIAMRWRPGGATGVKRMRASIRVVAVNKAAASAMPEDHEEPMAMAGTVASYFVDGNTTLAVSKRRLTIFAATPIPPALGFPLWSMIFDYHKPDVHQDTEVYAVNGPLVDRSRRQKRVATVTWPPGETTVLMTQRFPDQGSYDNVHIHGNMGDDPFDPRIPKHTMVHAPGCAEACLHWHWRWGWLASPGAFLSFRDNVPFRGWSRPSGRSKTSERNESWATPLIPPNQDLHVAVTHPDTTRSDPWSDVVMASRDLDAESKALWWTADVCDAASDAWQVIGESGISFAYQYNWSSSLLRTNIAWLRHLTPLWDIPAPRTDLQVLHNQYSLIRWYVDENFKATAEQIPEGTVIGSTGVALEQL